MPDLHTWICWALGWERWSHLGSQSTPGMKSSRRWAWDCASLQVKAAQCQAETGLACRSKPPGAKQERRDFTKIFSPPLKARQVRLWIFIGHCTRHKQPLKGGKKGNPIQCQLTWMLLKWGPASQNLTNWGGRISVPPVGQETKVFWRSPFVCYTNLTNSPLKNSVPPLGQVCIPPLLRRSRNESFLTKGGGRISVPPVGQDLAFCNIFWMCIFFLAHSKSMTSSFQGLTVMTRLFSRIDSWRNQHRKQQ